MTDNKKQMEKFISTYNDLIMQVGLWDKIKSHAKSGVSHLLGRGGDRRRTRDKLIREFIKAYQFKQQNEKVFYKFFTVNKIKYKITLTKFTSKQELSSGIPDGKYKGEYPNSATFYFKVQIQKVSKGKGLSFPTKWVKLRYNYTLGNIEQQFDQLVFAPYSLSIQDIADTADDDDEEEDDEYQETKHSGKGKRKRSRSWTVGIIAMMMTTTMTMMTMNIMMMTMMMTMNIMTIEDVEKSLILD